MKPSPEDIIKSAGGKPCKIEAPRKANGPVGGANFDNVRDTSDIIDSVALDQMEFPEPRFVLPGYITEGLGILAGRAKMGKSWLLLGLADAVARGGLALGKIQVVKGEVLYLGLEDPRKRLQKRLRAVRQGKSPAPALFIHTNWPKLDKGGLDKLRNWLSEHPQARLVIVDTFQKVRGKPSRAEAGVYEADYEAVGGLKSLADEFAVAIVLVLHLRKSAADDPLDEISSSTGLTGAADFILILKRQRGQADAVLFGTGRDIEEIETALQFDDKTGTWCVLGPAEKVSQSKEQNAIIRMLIDHGGPMSPKEMAEVLGKNRSTVQNMLLKMAEADLIRHSDGGKYRYA